jgi:hypothetical protein
MILNLYEFETLHGQLPTRAELQQYVTASMEMKNNPEDYWEKHRMTVPTPNLAELKPEPAPETKSHCSLCQGPICTGTPVYKMPCCGQYFHATADECLGDSTVIRWLRTSKKCPVCGQEVNLIKPK